MKRLSILLVVLFGMMFGCDSTIPPQLSDEEQFEIDLDLIDSWIAENGITDTLHHPTGIRYTINKKGTGIKAQVTDIITTSYEGRFLDTGIVFDSSSSFGPVVLNYSAFISGWYYMILEMQEGDEFTIYLPSFYAYGNLGSGTIPPNSVLVFDIRLIKVE